MASGGPPGLRIGRRVADAVAPGFTSIGVAGVVTGVAFFLLEKWVLWRHCHDDEACHVHSTAAKLVIVGDTFHTFVDGAVIAAAFLCMTSVLNFMEQRCEPPAIRGIVPVRWSHCMMSSPSRHTRKNGMPAAM